jgi:hypothetical protein
MQDLEQFLAFARRSRAIDDRSETVDGCRVALKRKNLDSDISIG